MPPIFLHPVKLTLKFVVIFTKEKKATETSEQLLPNVTDQKGEIGRGGGRTAQGPSFSQE